METNIEMSRQIYSLVHSSYNVLTCGVQLHI